jgi:hypothetical protein
MDEPHRGLDSNVVLDRRDGFEMTEVDEQIMARHSTQLALAICCSTATV